MNKKSEDFTGSDVRAKDLPPDVDYSKSETTKPTDPDTGKAMPQVTTSEDQRVMTTENAVAAEEDDSDNRRRVDEAKVICTYEGGALSYEQVSQKCDVPLDRVVAILERNSVKKTESAQKADTEQMKKADK